MNRRFLLYIPIVALFLFCAAAMTQHYAQLGRNHARFTREARLPFGYTNGRVYGISPSAAEAGVAAGDRIDEINGRVIENDAVVLEEELDLMRVGQPVRLLI